MHIQVNGLDFSVELTGAGAPVLLLHGFTGSTAAWGPIRSWLAEHRQVIGVDLIGHGRSACPADPDRYTMEHAVADLSAVLDRLNLDQVDVMGYSMGARLALFFAVEAPQRVHSLVLESGSPGLREAAERMARVAADEQLGDSIERDGLAAFVDYWEAIPLFASQLSLPLELRQQHRQQRLEGSEVGLANSLRGMGTGRQQSLWDELEKLASPVLILAGEIDDKYCTIAREMDALIPCSQLSVIPMAGHTIHLEQPELFRHSVEEFLGGSDNEAAKRVPGARRTGQ
ncbi:MAG: 2-succinyl-6-hydroxy-2,4-cyclohexadiene-1-carboxylate synthase [Chloroflexi bacterium]|nr:2-succinyl-6-hydroxy-2,4-cyclohexadiene-1-carboxylate synthase [Chloroflexota bacterium]